MWWNMIYTTYEYYIQDFGGSAIPKNQFDKTARLVSRYIDQFTFGRIKNPSEVDGLQDCACEMSDTLYAMNLNKGKQEKKSENNDGYSVTYVTERTDGQTFEELLRRKLYEICRMYLLGSGLMCRKVCCKC